MMPFSRRLADNVCEGITRASFRLIIHPFYPKPGEKFVAHCEHSPLPGIYLCKRRSRCTLEKARKNYYRQIGLSTTEEYDSLMREILHCEVLPDTAQGTMYFFERVE
jgi:hypothetical protein